MTSMCGQIIKYNVDLYLAIFFLVTMIIFLTIIHHIYNGAKYFIIFLIVSSY